MMKEIKNTMTGGQKMDFRPNKISHFRKLLGWSQADLAVAIDTSQQNLHNYETGKVKPPLEKKEKIEEVLGIPLKALFPKTEV